MNHKDDVSQDLVVGRPRDSEDRIDWQIEHARFEDALDLAEKDVSLKSSTHQKVWHILLRLDLWSYTAFWVA